MTRTCFIDPGDELIGNGQAEDEACARRAQVEGGAVPGAELLLDEHGRRGHGHVGSDRPDDDHVELRRLRPAISSAFRAAAVAMSLVKTPSGAMRRSGCPFAR